MVASTLASVAHMYSTQKNSMTIPLTVNMWHKTTQTEAVKTLQGLGMLDMSVVLRVQGSVSSVVRWFR